MSITDFLFNGTAPKSVTTYGTSTSNVPQWISDFQQGIASKANAIAAQPYQAYNGPRIAGFNTDQTNAFQGIRDAQGSQEANFNSAISGARDAGAGANASGAAQPWLDKAGNPVYNTVNDYMNPYISNVVDRIGDMGARNLNEKFMPAINSDFIRAGQYGSTGQMAEIGKALRDTQGEVIAEQNKALSQGYQSALDTASSDANRFGQIGQTAGNMSDADTVARMNAAGKEGALATMAQDATYKDTNALGLAGAAEQQQTQSNLDLAHQDFVDQRDYQQNQLGWLNNISKGFEAPTSTTTSSTAPGTNFSASPISSALGTALSSYQLLNGQ